MAQASAEGALAHIRKDFQLPAHPVGLFIHPAYVPHHNHPSPLFPLELFASRLDTVNLIDHPETTYTKLKLKFTGQPRDVMAFAETAWALWRYLRSYRQPENGWAKPRCMIYHTLLVSQFYEVIYMTKQARTPRRPKGQIDIAFLDVPLDDADFEALDNSKVSASQLVANLIAATEQGFRLSFSYKKETKRANAMFTDTREGSATKDKAISAFSDDCAEALKLLLYKHVVKLEGDWTRIDQTPRPKRTRG